MSGNWFEENWALIRDHFPVMLAVLVAGAVGGFGLASLIYNGQIAALKERVALHKDVAEKAKQEPGKWS